MKYKICNLSALFLAMLFAWVNYAHAQDNNMSSEFEAFKLKLQQARQQPEAQPKKQAPKAQQPKQSQKSPSAKASPLSSVSPLSGGSGNPLGAAANLPVKGGMALPQQNLIDGQTLQMQEEAFKRNRAEAKRSAFDAALEQLMPLEPEQIRELLRHFEIQREASEAPVSIPKPRTEVKTVPMDPSAEPIEVKTANGYVTTITILDSTGSPWAIQDVSWAGKFAITGGEVGSHILRIIPESAHGIGNISIRLVDLITPITFSIVSGLDEVHYRLDARVPKLGPLAKTPLIDNSSITASSSVGGDARMVRFLEGVPTGDANSLILNGVDERTKAWRAGNNIYLRTPLTLLSPSWDSSVSSADGMNVYTLTNAPVLLLSDQGRMVKAYIINELGDAK